MDLIRGRTNCVAGLMEGAASSIAQLEVPLSTKGVMFRAPRILLHGEHDLSTGSDLPFSDIAVGSGYPVSAKRTGLVGVAALKAIANCLLTGSSFAQLEEFDGPFLVVTYQTSTQQVIVARDKFGLRQAYFSVDERGLVLSDDIDGLRQRWKSVRTGGLIEWMHYGAALEPLSLFEKIKCLAPGSIMSYSLDSGKYRVERYFSPEQYVSASQHSELSAMGVQGLRKNISETLDQTVANSVAGQQQVSILLSGGVDSSLVTAFARRHVRVSAVTIDIQGAGAESELHYAAEVARVLGVDLYPVSFGPREFVQTFCDTVNVLGTPLIIENAVALHYAACSGQLPSGQLVLDGEGADALMAGSTSLFKYSMTLLLLRDIPVLGRLPFRTLLECMRSVLGRIGIATKTTLDSVGLDAALGTRRMELELCEAKIRQSLAHVTPREAHEVSYLMLREFYDYLVPLMVRIDRMSAVAKTHTVLPFLSGSIFPLLQNIHMHDKIRWDWSRLRPVSKFIMKELLTEHLPHSLVYRPKVGFGIPGSAWIRMPEAWVAESWVAEHFDLSHLALEHWLTRNSQSRDKFFLASMEVWGRLFDWQIPFEEVEAEWLAAQTFSQ